MDNLTNSTPASAATATPVTDPAATTGTVQSSGQATGQSAPAQDSFTGVDPNTLPPQLKRAYDGMLKDYKSKTTEIAEQRKKYADYDDLKQKAGFYDQFSSREDAVKWWNEYVQKQNGHQNGTDATQDPVQAKLQDLEKRLEGEQQARRQTEVAQVVDAFSTAKDEKGQLLRPDFEELAGLDLGKTEDGDTYSLLRACVDLSPGKTPDEKLLAGYQAAKSIRDKIFEEGRKHGMGKMLSKVRNSTEAPTITSDKTSFTGDAKKLSVREARELAEKGVMVH